MLLKISAVFMIGALLVWLAMLNARLVPVPGFDYHLSHASCSNIFLYRQSQFDVPRRLDPPELRPSDGGWGVALKRYFDENIAWLQQATKLHPSQAHPILLSAYFAPTLLTDKETGSYVYNCFQAIFLALSLWVTAMAAGWRPRKSSRTTAFVLVVILSLIFPTTGTALHVNLKWGQTNLPVLMVMACALLAIANGKYRLAGGFIALAAGDKVFPILLFAAIPLAHWPRAMAGAGLTLCSLLAMMASHAGLVVILDTVRWPVFGWYSNYNVLTPGSSWWKYPPTNHGALHGIESVAASLSVAPYFYLIMGLCVGLCVIFSFLNASVVQSVVMKRSQFGEPGSRSRLLYRVCLTLLTFAMAMPSYREMMLGLLVLVMVCNITWRALWIRSTRRRSLAIAAVIMTFIFPVMFKLVYDHHLVFLMAGAWIFLVLLLTSRETDASRYAVILGMLASIVLFNAPQHVLPFFPHTFSSLLPSSPFLGFLVAITSISLWVHSDHFRRFSEGDSVCVSRPSGCGFSYGPQLFGAYDKGILWSFVRMVLGVSQLTSKLLRCR